jgi:hypothetical protein
MYTINNSHGRINLAKLLVMFFLPIIKQYTKYDISITVNKYTNDMPKLPVREFIKPLNNTYIKILDITSPSTLFFFIILNSNLL